MAGAATIFREIHRLRRHASELRSQLDRIPAQLKAYQNKITRREEILKEARDTLKALKVQTSEKEGQLKSLHQLVAKHAKQLDEAAGAKEYEALQHEIAAEKERCAALEEDILNQLGEIDDRTGQLPELEKAIAEAREEKARYEREIDQRKASLEEQEAKAREQLAGVEKELPYEAAQAYQRLASAKGDDALSAAENRACAACYTSITTQDQNNLMAGRLVVCKACDRILYLLDSA